MSCLVLWCKNKGNIPGISYFSMTKTRRKAWMRALGRDPNIENLSCKNVICSKHFSQEDICREGKRFQLRPNAVPTLYLRRSENILQQGRMGNTRYVEWMKALGRPLESEPVYSRTICSDHFTPDSFVVCKDRLFLKRTAVPSLKLKLQDYFYYHNDKFKSLYVNQKPTNLETYQDIRLSASISCDDNYGKETETNEYDNFVVNSPILSVHHVSSDDDDDSKQIKIDNYDDIEANMIGNSPVNISSDENDSNEMKYFDNVEEDMIDNPPNFKASISSDDNHSTETETDDCEEDVNPTILSTVRSIHSYCKTPEDELLKLNKQVKNFKNQMRCALRANARRKRKIIRQRQIILELKKQLSLSSKKINSLEAKLRRFNKF